MPGIWGRYCRTLLAGCVVTGIAIGFAAHEAAAQQNCAANAGSSGTATNNADLTCSNLSQAAGGGTANSGATAYGFNAFALGAQATSVGAVAGGSATVAGVTSIGANTNNFTGQNPGIFSTAIGGGTSTNGNGTAAAGSFGDYSVAIGGGDTTSRARRPPALQASRSAVPVWLALRAQRQ